MNNELTDTSSPAAMLWNSHNASLGTSYMGKPVTEITRNDDGTVSFLVMGGDDNNVLYNSTATGIATLKTTDSKVADRRVYSIDGRLLGTDINAMPKGLYIVGAAGLAGSTLGLSCLGRDSASLSTFSPMAAQMSIPILILW